MQLKKRAIALILSLVLLGTLGLSAFAANEGDTRVTIGADLNADEIATVYKIFGVDRGQVEELIVTNADERAYLEGLVSDAAIGTRAISCTYLEVLGRGNNITVKTENISLHRLHVHQRTRHRRHHGREGHRRGAL